MDVKYDVNQYLVSVKMSSKKRVLVEGKDDKAHIKNLIYAVLGNTKIKIDMAENIKGVCSATSANNRAKIDYIHSLCKSTGQYENLYLLCDREFLKFNVGNQIEDFMNDHEKDGNLNWTLGHSLENYFIDSELIVDAFSYLTASEFKVHAIELFKNILPSAVKVVAAITLSARDIESCSYPSGTIQWNDFLICQNDVGLDFEKWKQKQHNNMAERFLAGFTKYTPIVKQSDQIICSRICRGHTAILMLQRIFSACLYHVGKDSDEFLSKRDASLFGNMKESSVSGALSEAWIRRVKTGDALYPVNLVEAVA